MDFEEEWRAAMMEAAAPQPPQRPLTSANPPAQKDVYDEFSDDDLMQSLPFANDTAPAFSTEPILLPSALLLSSAAGTNAPSGSSAAASAPRRTLMKAGAATSTPLSATAAAAQPTRSAATPPAPATSTAATSTTRPARKEPQRGVLNFPPAHGASFLLRGDDGRVRWVTAEGGAMISKRTTTTVTTSQTAAVTDGPARGRATRRKRTRAESPTTNGDDAVVVIGDDEESNMEDGGVGAEGTTRREAEVVDVDSAASADGANSTSGGSSDADSDVGIEDASPSSLLAAAEGVSQGRGDEAHQDNGNDDEDDDDDEDEGGRGLRQAPAFLRDGLHVRDLMQSMYAEDAEKEAKQKAAAQQRRYRDEDGDGLHPSDPFATPQRRSLDVAATPQSGATAPPARAARLQGSGELWVTKYSPKLFREVLSDESINLQLLQWLKSWDAYVFPEQQQQQQQQQLAGGGAAGQAVKGSVGGPLAGGSGGTAVAAAAPPDERIAVLTGPPGVGKTTLVHVLAAHCGYEVIEVNASVERTASRLEALIKTAVSAAGPAPGGRLRRPVNTTASMPGRRVESGHGGHHNDDRGEAAAERSGGATSLVQHLLRPKCLVIDEMDGIASSSVATYLIQQQLHRPVFCLCNDLYVPSLRPLRQRCSHVFYMPPIRSQRLLARLEDIARRERVTGLDSMALSELITVSGGDVRSCLNTMQFIHSVLTQQQQNGEAGTGAAVPTQRHTVTELIRRMQGKDTRVVLKDTWQMLFARPERNKAVQMLKQECGVDYEALVEAAAAQNHRQHERDRGRGQPAYAESTGPASALHGSGAGEQDVDVAPGPHRRPRLEVAKGFRVDPGYLFAAHQLARCPDTAGLLDGLQENYLDRAYTDYTFARTSATAACFSQQDMIVTASFQHPELMGAAERMGQVSALTCYVHCSTAARGGRIEFPREQATLRRLQSESQHVSQQLRDGCRPQLALFLGGEEATSTETAPMLLRCLVDRTLRLPAHAIASFSRLPAVDQALLQASVARHVEYGLDYERDRQYTPPAPSQFFGGAAGGRPHSLFSSNAEVDDVPWRLTPQLDRLVAGVVRPMETALSGGRGGGGGGGHAPYARGRFGERGAHPGGGGGARGGLGATAAAAAGRPSLSSVMMPLKNEVRQILVGEIRQYRIMQSVEFLKRQQQSAAAAGAAKRPRDDEEDATTITSTTATAAANGGATPANACSPAPEPPTVPANAASLAQLQGAESNAKTGDGAGESGTAAARSLPDAKRQRADQDGKEAEEGNVEDATPATTAAAAAAVASPTTRTQAVRRDFFGRPIPDTGAATASAGRRGRSANTAATTPSTASPSPTGVTGGGGGGGFPRSQPPNVPPMQASVKYIYQDGATNAVKMPAVFADF